MIENINCIILIWLVDFILLFYITPNYHP